MLIQRFRKNGGFDYISCEGFFGNKYNSYIHIARNAKVASTGNVHEKIWNLKIWKYVLKRKKKDSLYSEAATESCSYDLIWLFEANVIDL